MEVNAGGADLGFSLSGALGHVLCRGLGLGGTTLGLNAHSDEREREAWRDHRPVTPETVANGISHADQGENCFFKPRLGWILKQHKSPLAIS